MQRVRAAGRGLLDVRRDDLSSRVITTPHNHLKNRKNFCSGFLTARVGEFVGTPDTNSYETVRITDPQRSPQLADSVTSYDSVLRDG
jgi:hypothetical protein